MWDKMKSLGQLYDFVWNSWMNDSVVYCGTEQGKNEQDWSRKSIEQVMISKYPEDILKTSKQFSCLENPGRSEDWRFKFSREN